MSASWSALAKPCSGTANQLEWCTNVILPGVLMAGARLASKEQPPIVIRTHAMDADAIMPSAYLVYSNIFTESKYNGESLTTYGNRGARNQTVQLHMAMLLDRIWSIFI